jgi:plastocyanin
MLTRRTVVAAGLGLASAGIIGRSRAASPAPVIEIRMKSNPMGGRVGFDPIGVLLQQGQRVRWICDANVHTTTAYSPENNNHPLRIPENAKPWASDFLLPGETFEATLTFEGVYDYFCAPHEAAGMVGRLIVGRPTGPGALPFDYFEAEGQHRNRVPLAARKAFPSIEDIMRLKVVSSPLNFSK